MADAAIAASDVSATIIDKQVILVPGQSRKRIRALVKLTIDAGEASSNANTYTTGGIVLTNLFTANGNGYTGIDPALAVHGLASIAVSSNSPAIGIPAMFYDGAATAAGKTLVLYEVPFDDGSTEDILNEIDSGIDLTDAAYLNGDHNLIVYLQLWGTAADGQ